MTDAVEAITKELDQLAEDVLLHIRAGKDCPLELAEAWGGLMNELIDLDHQAFCKWLCEVYGKVSK